MYIGRYTDRPIWLYLGGNTGGCRHTAGDNLLDLVGLLARDEAEALAFDLQLEQVDLGEGEPPANEDC